MNAITLSDFFIPVHIGCEEIERSEDQLIRIDLLIETDFRELLEKKSLDAGIDYAEIRRFIKELVVRESFVFLEDLGEAILERALEHPRAIFAEVRVQKMKRWKDALPGVIMERSK